MSVQQLQQKIEHDATVELVAGRSRDAQKQFYLNNITAGEEPTPVLHGLKPAVTIAQEKIRSIDLHQPGQYCYRTMAIAIAPGRYTYSRKLLINCPFCNKTQFLFGHSFEYELPSDKKTKQKVWLNKWLQRLFKREWYNMQGQGLLTINSPITCQYNKLHRYTVVKNKISFYYPLKQNIVQG